MEAPAGCLPHKRCTFFHTGDAVQAYCAQWRLLLEVWTNEGNPDAVAVAKKLLSCSRTLHAVFVGDDACDSDPIVRLMAPVRILPAEPRNIYFIRLALSALERRCTALEAHQEGALAYDGGSNAHDSARFVEKIIYASMHMLKRRDEAKVALRRAKEERARLNGEQLRREKPVSGRYAAQIEAVERRLEELAE